MQQLLVPTDFSPIAQGAFRYAVALAQALGAQITLLYVYQTDFSMPLPSTATFQLLEAQRERGLAGIQKMIESVGDTGITITPRMESGITWDVIGSVAKSGNFDGIVIGTKGEHNVAEVVFGSVTTHVIRYAHCPVWVVPEGYTYQPIRQIAYATDLSGDNTDAVVAVIELATQLKSAVHCVHVNTDTSDDAFERSTLEELIQVHAQDVALDFQQIESTSVNEGIAQFVQSQQIDLLALLRPQRSLFERLFHRSQTRQLALHTAVPLYVFRPLS